MWKVFKNLLARSNNEALQTALRNGALLVDVRSPLEFGMGSVVGAINIPLEKLHEQTDQLTSAKDIVVFCRSGSRSHQAKRLLERRGFAVVHNGGSWQQLNKLVQATVRK